MGASPRFEENGGARRKGGEATPRGDRGCEPRHWWREEIGQSRHLYICKCPRGVSGPVERLPRYLHLVLLGYAWFKLGYHATQATSEPRVLHGKAKIEGNEARDVPKEKGGSEEAIRHRFLGCCSVPRMGHQYHVGP